MAGQNHRAVAVERIAPGQFKISNGRGGEITVSSGGAELSPVELLLGAIGACTGMDVEALTSRRAEPDRFAVQVGAEKVRNEDGNHLTDVTVTFRVAFPEGEDGDRARAVLPEAVRRSHDRLCTVSRTVELGSTVTSRIADDA